MIRLTGIFMILLMAAPSRAAIQGEMVEYRLGDKVFDGYLAYDDVSDERRPGVIVVHDWMGFGNYSNSRATMLAEMGYIALAIDIYGQDIHPKDRSEAGQQAGYYKRNIDQFRAHAGAGLDYLRKHPLVDSNSLAAIGYCFGGTAVLEMARAGFPLKGVVSFHGGLSTPRPEDATNIKGRVLVLHGADDPHVPPEEVTAFQKEMNDANVDWEMIYYSDAVHAFTKRSAGSDKSSGAAYNEKADQRSWSAMKQFFSEIF